MIARWTLPQVLESTGLGVVLEEQRAWEGYWNERVVSVVKTSMADPVVLTVLLSGRNADFANLLDRMTKAKGLRFDLLVLKPENLNSLSTIDFKLKFLDDILPPNSTIEEVVIYEDRKGHEIAFEEYFHKRILPRKECIDVSSYPESQYPPKPSSCLKIFQIHHVELPIKYLEKSVEKGLILGLGSPDFKEGSNISTEIAHEPFSSKAEEEMMKNPSRSTIDGRRR